jgi:hypothetical protein
VSIPTGRAIKAEMEWNGQYNDQVKDDALGVLIRKKKEKEERPLSSSHTHSRRHTQHDE